jgi:hypothetical protein
MVDSLLDRPWDRQAGAFAEGSSAPAEAQPADGATCSCGSGIPIQTIDVAGKQVVLAGLPFIFQQMHEAGRRPEADAAADILATVKVYNPVPAGAEAGYAAALLQEYAAYCAKQEVGT